MLRTIRWTVAIYRNSFSGLPAETWLLCAAAFINRCGAMVLPFLSIYLGTEFGYGVKEAGQIVALYGLGAVLGSWLGGRLADALGCITVQVVTLGGAGVWMFVLSRIEDPSLLGPGVFVLGTLNDAFRPGSVTAVAISVDADKRRKALALNRLMLNAGWAVGPTLGGFLILWGRPPGDPDYERMFFADGATCLVSALFLAVLFRGFQQRRQSANDQESTPQPQAGPTRVAGPGPFRDPHFLWLMALNFLVTTAFLQYFTTGSRIFKEDYGYNEETIGLLLAINPILITLLEMPVVHGLRHRAALPIIAIGSLAMGAGFLFFLPAMALGWVIVALLVVTLGEVLQMPLLGAYINDHAPARLRGAYNGAYGVSFALALVAAPAIGGWIYDEAGGATTLWWWCACAGIVSAIGFQLSHRRLLRQIS